MLVTRSILGALGVAAVLATPVAAQDRAVSVFARSGGYNALTDLDDAGTADFGKVGYNVGGGLAVQLHRFVAVRGDFTYAQNELRSSGADTGNKLNRFFYDAAVQLQYPTDVGVTPYVFAGGGAVTFHEVGTSGQDKTKGAGTFGLGLNYTIPRTSLGVFAEGKGWLYDASNLNGSLSQFDKTQVEVAWTGGLSYRFPF
jgi:hypothetical protein